QYSPAGQLVTVEDVDGWRRICVDGSPISPDGWQIRGVSAVHADCVIATASTDPTQIQVVRFGTDGSAEALTEGAAVHGAVVAGGTTVLIRSGIERVGTT